MKKKNPQTKFNTTKNDPPGKKGYGLEEYTEEKPNLEPGEVKDVERKKKKEQEEKERVRAGNNEQD